MKEEHLLRVPEQGSLASLSKQTTIKTAQGTEVWVGDIIRFDRLPNTKYKLQAFHDVTSENACFANFHAIQSDVHSAFIIGFDMGWKTLADAFDSEDAIIVDKA